MREIKFRGKLLDNDKWAIGDLRHRNDGSLAIITNLNVWSDNNDKVDAYREEFEVDPATVGQYTGLKDKDGKEIFEGDIVKWENLMKTPMRSVIRYMYNGFRFTDFDGEDQEIWCGVFEAIGNIHDNPELMKGGEL